MPSFPQESVDAVLSSSDDSSVIAAELFRLAKKWNPHFSYTILCKLAGIRSRGYLSDVLRGQRRLRLRYVEGFCRALGLNPFSTKVFHTLVEMNEEELVERKEELKKRLDAMRQLMSARHAQIKSMDGRHFFELEMVSAFGLFGGRATFEQLAAYYTERDPKDVMLGLRRLHDDGLLLKDGDVYAVKNDFVCFVGSEDGRAHLDYISYILDDTKRWALRSFREREEHIFESFVISVRKDQVPAFSKEIREKFYQWVAGLNVNDGDELVRFSVQLHPLR